ncbi:MAG: hypothetical protein AAFO63_12215, partial [Pseudomonadota bacterium]
VNYNTFFNAGSLFEAATGMTPQRTYQFEDNFLDALGNPVSQTRSVTLDNTCVLERFGDQAFTDAAPDPTPPGELPITVPVSVVDAFETTVFSDRPGVEEYTLASGQDNPYGFVAAPYRWTYDNPDVESHFFATSYGTFCNDQGPLPLTDERDDLDQYLTDLMPTGNTAGHQGVAWGWYLLSEHWASSLPTESEPAPYSDPSTLKAIVFMTDGLMDAIDIGFGNGDPQARALCDSIKADTRIRIYTVGFQLGAGAAQDLMDHCASEPEFSFAPENSAELAQSYVDIANSLVNLRITF